MKRAILNRDRSCRRITMHLWRKKEFLLASQCDEKSLPWIDPLSIFASVLLCDFFQWYSHWMSKQSFLHNSSNCVAVHNLIIVYITVVFIYVRLEQHYGMDSLEWNSIKKPFCVRYQTRDFCQRLHFCRKWWNLRRDSVNYLLTTHIKFPHTNDEQRRLWITVSTVAAATGIRTQFVHAMIPLPKCLQIDLWFE